MPSAKIPVLEIEKLSLSEDGRGINVYNDGTNAWVYNDAWSLSGKSSSGGTADGWLRVSWISGNTSSVSYVYIPFYTSK